MNSPGSVLQKLRDRRMIQVLLLYLGAGWALAQVAEFVVDNYGLSRKFLDITLLLTILGIPAAMVIAWFHGVKGSQRAPRSEATILLTLAVLAAIGTYRIGTAETAVERVRSPIVLDLGDESVAVLPFTNSIPDPDLAWLSDGLAELLMAGLAQVPNLKVVSGQHVFDLLRLEGKEDAEEISETLATSIALRAGARYMVDGTILGSSDDMIVNANLVDVETGRIAAAARRRGPDVFALVDSVSADLAAQILGSPAQPTEMASVASVTTANLEAFREYQLALVAERRFRFDEAIAHYQSAVELDPAFALAHIRLSGLALRQGRISLGVTELQAAREHRESAPLRDQMFLDAMLAGTVERDVDKSRRILSEVVETYPDDKEARAALWGLYPAFSDERRSLLEETLRLDPLYAGAYNELAYWHAQKGDIEAADSLIRLYIGLLPGEPNPLDSRGEILERAGRLDEARESYREALRIQPDFLFSLDHLARTYLRENRPAAARQELEPWTQHEIPTVRARAWVLTGDSYLWEGQIETGIRMLERASEEARAAGIHEAGMLSALLPIYLATHDFESLAVVAGRLQQIDLLNPTPALASVAALGEQGELTGMDVLAAQVRDRVSDSPEIREFLPTVVAGLASESSFYRGEYEVALAYADTARDLGGLPFNGNHAYLRSLLETGRAEQALRAAIGLGNAANARQSSAKISPVLVRQALYFEGRAHELLSDTAAAVTAYESLLYGWEEAIERFPVMRDAPARLAALKP